MNDAGLPPAARLRQPRDFAALRHARGRISGHYFLIRCAANQLGLARMGQAVSKRISKKAVERNRIKRLVRDSFRRHRHELCPVDVLIVPRPSACRREGRVLLEELDQAWARIRALKLAVPPGTIAG